MDLITTLFISVSGIYLFKIISVIKNKDIRYSLQQKNIRLEELRMKHNKTVEEQKEFIDLKYPKNTGKFFTLVNIKNLLVQIIKFIIYFTIATYVFNYFSLTVSMWQLLFMVFIVPIIINKVLKKFHLQGNDLSDLI